MGEEVFDQVAIAADAGSVYSLIGLSFGTSWTNHFLKVRCFGHVLDEARGSLVDVGRRRLGVYRQKGCSCRIWEVVHDR